MKQVMKLIQRVTGPISRPLLRRFDDRVSRLVANSVNARVLPELVVPLTVALDRLARIEDSLARADQTALGLVTEVDLVLNGVSREVFRLQAQLEHLQTTLARDARMINGDFSIVDHAGDKAPVLRGSLVDRSRVG